MGKKAAVVVDDGTPYGKGIADQFAEPASPPPGALSSGAGRRSRVRRISPLKLAELPKDFDVMFFGGIKKGRRLPS